jgi:hypothetical protein
LPCSRRPPLSSLVPVPEWGDVPGWLQAAGEAGALYLAVRGRRQAQAVDWARTLKELSGLSEEELRRLVEDNPVIAEIVGRAWEAAAETASDDKRRLLAKVAAAAIRGDAAAEVDELQLLLRTVIELDPPHITLLVAISRHGGSPEQITASWPSRPELFRAAVAALDRSRPRRADTRELRRSRLGVAHRQLRRSVPCLPPGDWRGRAGQLREHHACRA